jgi:hypothetical protein
MKAASPRFVVVNICEDSILYRLSELPFESSAVLVVQGVYCDALHLAALSAIVAKVRYLCMLYTPSANPPSQSYLAVKPAESKIVPVEAGQELTGGWVINKAGHVITGKLGKQKVEIFARSARVLDDFVNTTGDPKSIQRFTRDYGVLKQDDRERFNIGPSDSSADFIPGDRFLIHCDEWLEAQHAFRTNWEAGKNGGEELAQRLSTTIAPGVSAGPVVKARVKWSRRGFLLELQPDDLWRALSLAFIGFSDRMRKCQNPTCVAPYFLATRRDQRYCSEKCARLVANRKWWDKHGQQWRDGRSEKKKSA